MANGTTREFDSFGPPDAGEMSGADKLLVKDAETNAGYNPKLSDLEAFLASRGQHLVLAQLPSAEKRNIPDGDFLISLNGQLLHLDGAALADFIDDAISQALTEAEVVGDNGWTATPSIVHDGNRRLIWWSYSGGSGSQPANGYATRNTGDPPDPSTLTTVKADAADLLDGIMIPQGGGGGMAVDPATQAETLAGVVANKYVSPLTLEEKVTAAVFEFARTSVTALTPAQIEAVQKRLDVLTFDGHWNQVLAARPWANVPVGTPHDTGLDVAADADDLRLNFVGVLGSGGGGVFVVDLASLRANQLPANPPGFLVSQNGWRVLVDADGNRWGVGLRGSRVWVAADQDPRPGNRPFTVTIEARTGQIEDFARADSADRVPEDKMPQGWVQFTSELRNRLLGIPAGAEANVQADLTVTDPNSDAHVRGQAAFIAALPHLDVTQLPDALPSSTTKVVVEEADNRRDATLSFEMVAGQEYWGGGRGGLVAPTDDQGRLETAKFNAEVFGALWDSGDRQLFLWLKVGGVFDRAIINAQTHAMTELAAGAIPWVTGSPNYRRVQIVLPADQATAIDDGLSNVALNLQDSTADLHESFLVGNPFSRGALRPDDRLQEPDFTRLLDQQFRYVDVRPAGHETDNVTYLFPPPAG